MSFGSANVAQRVASKASSVYSKSSTDLVDAADHGAVDLAKLKVADLPEAMREMNEQERAAYIQEQAAKRAAIQARVRVLTAERDAYLTQERVKLARTGGDTLGDAVVRSVREQLGVAGFDVNAGGAPE